MDHLTALKVFRQVVEQGGFASASRQLGLSPAAVSKNIAELERHVAARLLNRTTRRMSLTEAGTRYYEQVARILDDLQEAEQSLGPMQREPAGLLRVSAPMSLSLLRICPAVPAFLERHPQVSLDLNLEDRRVDIVKEGFDLAIRGTDRLEDSSLVARKLMTLDHVLCGAPSYFQRVGVPASPEVVRGMERVQFTLSGHADEWVFTRAGQTQRVPVNGRYKVSSSLAVRDALRAGFGVSLVPRVYVQDDLDRGALQAVLPDWLPVETYVYAVYPSRRHMVAKVRAFVDFLVEELGARQP
jgi:DNA-binding transcriptional LysR family regulator